MRLALSGIPLVMALLAVGCAINPVTGEDELRIITTGQEVVMGQRIDAYVRSQYNAVERGTMTARVETIGGKIGAVTDRKEIVYRFALLDSEELNAFAAPGGFIYVTTQLAGVATDDSELAAVIAHEVGHVAALHSVHQMQRELGYEILKALVFGDPKSDKPEAAADVAFNYIIQTGFSRQDEYQADDLGVKYAAKAGYDPYGMAHFFVKLQQRQREGQLDRAFEFMRSHPNTEDRRQRAEAEAAKYAGGRR